jgi:hypothetical protein
MPVMRELGCRDEWPHDQAMAIHYSKKIKNRAPPDFITVAYRRQAIVHAMAPLVEGILPKKALGMPMMTLQLNSPRVVIQGGPRTNVE